MKIVFVIDSWNKGNGCIVVTHTLAKELQDRGHEISLVCTAGEEASNFKWDCRYRTRFLYAGGKGGHEEHEISFWCGKERRYSGRPSREPIWLKYSSPTLWPEMQ